MGRVTHDEHLKILASRNSYHHMTIRKIAKASNHSTTTIQAWIRKQPGEKTFRKARASIFDPFRNEIEALLNDEMGKQSRNVKTAMRDFREAHPDLIFGKSAFYQFVRDRCDLTREPKLASIPLQHDAGEAQIDFCDAVYYRRVGGRYRRVDGHQFTMYFPRCDVGFVQLFPAENQQCLFEGMRNIFEYIGFVPRSILFDNASTAVLTTGGKGKNAVPMPEYKNFAVYYGFEYIFCNPASGNEKGGVERENANKRQNYLTPPPRIDDEESFNRELLDRCLNDAKGSSHYRLSVSKAELFEADKQAGLPLPKVPLECRRTEFRKTNKCGVIQLQNSRYSVSDKHAQRWVVVKYGAFYIDIYDIDGTLILRHRRSYMKDSITIDKTMYADALKARPRARIKESENEYTEFWNDLEQVVTSKRPAARTDALVDFCEQRGVAVAHVPSVNAMILYNAVPYETDKECYDKTIQSNGGMVQKAKTG